MGLARVGKMAKTLPAETKTTSGGHFSVPRHCTLDGFARETSRHRGVEVAHLPPLTRLNIWTQNSFYRLTLLDPHESKAIVQGGRFFSEPSDVHFCGSSYGGTLLKMSWIGIGMRLELLSEGRRIITSPVISVEKRDDASLPGPF